MSGPSEVCWRASVFTTGADWLKEIEPKQAVAGNRIILRARRHTTLPLPTLHLVLEQLLQIERYHVGGRGRVADRYVELERTWLEDHHLE